MATLKLHVDEPAGEFDPIPFPSSLAHRARRAEPPRRRQPDSIRMAEDAMRRVDGHLGRLRELVGTDDDDHPRAA
ncbi:MAG: hypothetical protein IT436_00745 [Phycisphaerales bacterium]|nr:hypothetical protein [Phycisphaerales bacterium]